MTNSRTELSELSVYCFHQRRGKKKKITAHLCVSACVPPRDSYSQTNVSTHRTGRVSLGDVSTLTLPPHPVQLPGPPWPRVCSCHIQDIIFRFGYTFSRTGSLPFGLGAFGFGFRSCWILKPILGPSFWTAVCHVGISLQFRFSWCTSLQAEAQSSRVAWLSQTYWLAQQRCAEKTRTWSHIRATVGIVYCRLSPCTAFLLNLPWEIWWRTAVFFPSDSALHEKVSL